MELYDKMSESIILPREVLVPLLFSHLNYALLTQPLEASDEVTAHINDTWKALLDIEPYFNHSQQGWLFIDVYTSLYGNPPPSD
jgi:hypothetical protein